MSTIDQQFIEYIVKSLVSKPDAVVIDRRVDEKGVLLELHVDQEDLGRVIGKRGATAQSLRTLLRALGTKQDARLNLKIIDPNQPERDYDSSHENSSSDQNHQRDEHQSSDDSVTTNDDVANEPVSAPAPEVETEVQAEDNSHSDRLSQARKELAEYDDLDV
ncbi:MAG TPA: KH domain-containing protein [Candidatus Dormibacteraeota bacterium]|nr:KH domain-containing protein [Candidatus Dormibacteraeota bacterium]